MTRDVIDLFFDKLYNKSTTNRASGIWALDICSTLPTAFI